MITSLEFPLVVRSVEAVIITINVVPTLNRSLAYEGISNVTREEHRLQTVTTTSIREIMIVLVRLKVGTVYSSDADLRCEPGDFRRMGRTL